MIHHCVLVELKKDVLPDELENLILETRINLLKIPEIQNLRTGKNLNIIAPWRYFFAFDCESRAKLEMIRSHPVYVKFEQVHLAPHTVESLTLDYEMDPGRDVRYS